MKYKNVKALLSLTLAVIMTLSMTLIGNGALAAPTLDEINELYRKTGCTIQTLVRRELLRLAKTGEIPDYMRAEKQE